MLTEERLVDAVPLVKSSLNDACLLRVIQAFKIDGMGYLKASDGSNGYAESAVKLEEQFTYAYCRYLNIQD